MIANVMAEILLLLATATLMGLGLYVASVPLLALMLWRGWRLVKSDAKGAGWVEVLLTYGVPASLVLCYRAIKNGHWL